MRVLIISPCTPDPDGVGWEQRIYSQLLAYSERCEVHLWFTPTSDSPCLKRLPKIFHLCATVKSFHRQSLLPKGAVVQDLIAHVESADIVHVFRFPELVGLIKHPNLLWDIDELPLEVRQTSRLSLSDSIQKERLAKREVTKELYCSNRLKAKLVFAASSVESDDIFKIDYVLPNVVRLPPFQEKSDSDLKSVKLLFVGNLNKQENIEAVLFIVNDLLPRLPAELKLQVVGRAPKWKFAKAALATVWNNPRVDAAFDSESCTPFYTPWTVVLVTLLSGAGTKLKLLEALAHGSPVVATPKATEGLELLNNVHLMVGRDGSEIASKIMHLASSFELRERLRKSGYDQVKKLYAQNQVNEVIDRCITSLATKTSNLS